MAEKMQAYEDTHIKLTFSFPYELTIYLLVDVIDRCDDMRKVVIAVPSRFGVSWCPIRPLTHRPMKPRSAVTEKS